jgi:PKHD-type hydroxylase
LRDQRDAHCRRVSIAAPRFSRPRAEDARAQPWAYVFDDDAAAALPEGNNWVAATSVVARLFSPDECERIRELGESLSLEPGRMTRPGMYARRCSYAWMESTDASRWIYERIAAAVREANAGYRFELRGMLDPLQFTRYDAQTHDEIGWHVDCGEGPNTTRKLSLTVQLSPPDAYAGGDLEFLAMPGSSFMRHMGAAILFPALLAHRVTPILSGSRCSLVAFFNGPPFR